jgi:hypothetical protein
MAAAVPAATIAALALSAAATGYQVYNSEEAQGAAADQARKQNDAQARLYDDQKKQASDLQAKQDAEAAGVDARNSAQARQRLAAQAANGRTDTILTSPLGIPQPAPAPQKTLLGL